jgi:ligand-binding sensor domain-containing protein/AraC-like DNA-binding protein
MCVMKKLVFVFFILLSATLAANPFKTLIHRSWSSDEGLPQNSIYSIAQDKEGFLWIGTAEGLVRFDGFSFKLFDKYAFEAFKSNVVLAIHEAADGCLFVGLRNGGLVRKCGEEFRHFSTEHGLSSNTITSIVEYDGRLFLGTFGGKVSVFKDGFVTGFPKNGFIPDSFIHHMAVSPSGALHIATDDGLYAVNDEKVIRFGIEEGLPELKIRAVFFDSKGNLWVGTSDSGLALFKNGKFEIFTRKNGLASDRIFAIEEDGEGNIWIATVGGGISIFSGGSFFTFEKEDGLTSNVVRSLFKDRENNVWAGTFGGGINQFRRGLFSSISSNDGLSDNVIFALLESSNGDIYAGTYGKGLNIVGLDGSVKILNSSNGLSGDIPAAIHEDSEGRIWVGSYGTNLDIIDKNGKITNFDKKDGLEMNTIVSIFEDGDGTVYLGGYNHPLSVYKNGKFTTYTREGILKNRTIWAINQDKDGNILLGTDGAGIIKMNNNEFTVIDKEKGLSDNKITSIYRDKEDVLWVGTYDNGLNIITPDGQIYHVKKEHGLFDDTIYAIVEDNEKNIWMSSNRGLFSLGRDELLSLGRNEISSARSKVYSWKDGMPSNECNGGFQHAGIKTRDGKLMFPTIKGIAVMDPKSKKERPYMPDPVITSVWIDGKKQAFSQQYHLEPKAAKIRLEFTAPIFSLPEKILFRYRLNGFDSNWTVSERSRSAEFMNLEPGEYVFEVGVSDSEGNWNELSGKVTVIKKPAWHQNPLFRIIMLLVAGFAVFIPVNRKMKRMKIKNEELSDLITETEEEIKQISEELDSKYASSSLSEEDLDYYKEVLEKYMQSEKPYLDNELTIRKLAGLLEMQPHHLSQVINSGFENNFYTYINNYRIKEVIELMKDPKRHHHTILAIAYDSGFKSKSSFNTIFKKMTGKTPSEYREELES